MLRPFAAICSLLLLCTAACDNIGRAWDPDVGPPSTAESSVAVVPRGGDAREGRPKVKSSYPSGAGWPSTVPILIEFSESVNQSLIAPTSANGTDGRIILRVQGSTQALPCAYDFLGQGRLLLMRPIGTLNTPPNANYEVVLLPDARDVDGVTFLVDAEGTVLTTFQANQDASVTAGRILAVYPKDNARDATRETGLVVVFDRPANASTLRVENLYLRPQGGVAVPGELKQPLSTAGVEDTRVTRFTPSDTLAAAQRYELVVTEDITFGTDSALDFGNKTPFSRFTTVAPAAPTAVVLGNPDAGFDDKINAHNALSARLRVTTAADSVAGDRVLARIYGGDAGSAAAGDFVYAQRTIELPTGGTQDVDVDFSTALGTLSKPLFDDGAITYAVQLQRGSEHSGFLLSTTVQNARFDITPPTLLHAGPPASADGTDLFSDTESVSFYGVASEGIAEATLTDGTSTVNLFASSDDGSFLMLPIDVGRKATPHPYSLILTDRAGNMIAAAATGNIRMRGMFINGTAGQLTVEAYDSATLLPLVGATVLVDPATPTRPATGQLAGTTDSDGRATFTGLGSGARTVTIVRAGYDLVTLYATQAGHVSLPLRPTSNATATFRGTVAFASANGSVITAPTGATVIVGNSAIASRSPLGVRTASNTPNTIPDTAVLANRPQIVTTFGGTFQAQALPTFGYQGVQMLGPTLLTPMPPVAPAPGGSVSQQVLSAIDTGGSVLGLVGGITKDFAFATGLDTGNLVGGTLSTRVTMSVPGFSGQALAGIGTVTANTGSSYSFNANFGTAVSAAFVLFNPLYWVVAEARDTAGRVSRHRSFISGSQVVDTLEAQAIPVITTPGGPSTGSPAVTVDDVLDESIVIGGAPVGEALLDLTATDGAGRNWLLICTDRDAAGGSDTFQFPDLATAGVTGLAAGTWTVVAEARLTISNSLAGNDDLMLSERFRSEVLYSRSQSVQFTVQ
ncbi:MAG: Ig-like domain-containing protein [Planctomycetes bacterium]|nr:Ig-like domain-containing protein [Planctomycetota bacterium]